MFHKDVNVIQIDGRRLHDYAEQKKSSVSNRIQSTGKRVSDSSAFISAAQCVISVCVSVILISSNVISKNNNAVRAHCNPLKKIYVQNCFAKMYHHSSEQTTVILFLYLVSSKRSFLFGIWQCDTFSHARPWVIPMIVVDSSESTTVTWPILVFSKKASL